MAITTIRPMTPGLAGVEPLSKPEETSGGPFSKIVDHFLTNASKEQAQADQAVRDLVTGRTDNLHSVMLAVAKADLSFRMILETRNRLTDAFQEIMRMQV